jgi:hypothetical protein
VQNLQDEKRELEATLREVEGGAGDGRVNVGAIKGEIQSLDTAIHERTAPKTTIITRDRLVIEEKELEKAIAEGMPTQDEMRRPSRNPGAVRKHLAWNERNLQRIERYVEIQRTLRPLEPKSIEVLRKEK